jgi:hypothetical protein
MEQWWNDDYQGENEKYTPVPLCRQRISVEVGKD